MTKSINVYKDLTKVELKDGTILSTTVAIDKLSKELEGKSGFIMIDGVLFNKFEFKKARVKQLDEIETFIFSLPRNDQRTIRQEIKAREDKGLKINIKTITNAYNRLVEDGLAGNDDGVR